MKKKNNMVTLIVTIDKSELTEEIKRQMIRDGYPEADLADFENMMDEQDICQRIFGFSETVNVEIEED